MSTLIRVEALTRIFDVSKPWLNRVLERLPKAKLTAVSDVSFEIEENSVYALVGESGSGKSTIGKMITGLVPPTKGRIEVNGKDISTDPDSAEAAKVRVDIQMIFQDPYASLNPRWKVRNIIAEPVAVRGGKTEGLAERMLEQVGLSGADADKYPHEFSGGQRQRIAIARALSSKPEFIVCDEPTSALDVSVQAQILNLMRDLQDEFGLTYLLISHDLSVVRHMATRIGVLYLGRLVEVAQGKRLFAEPQHPYTRMLLDAVPDLALSGRRRRPVEGEIPNPISPPSGCAFHPRCPLAFDRCRTEIPQPRPTPAGQAACHALDDMVSA